MKRNMGILLLVFVYVCGVEAASFKLRHGNLGPTYGPFEFKDGEQIELGEWILTLEVVETTSATSGKSALSNIILPHVDFTNESIDACFEKLNTMIQAQAPDREGCNIVLGAALQQEDRTSIYSFREYPQITIQLQEVSALDAIQSICQQGGLTCALTDNGVFIDHPLPTPAPAKHPAETLSY
ncbi:MAG: hypothetical protein EOM20_01815 [Spartobacteria bacterium]|nr:hypothetical protein [Spartobacteria bacterium]